MTGWLLTPFIVNLITHGSWATYALKHLRRPPGWEESPFTEALAPYKSRTWVEAPHTSKHQPLNTHHILPTVLGSHSRMTWKILHPSTSGSTETELSMAVSRSTLVPQHQTHKPQNRGSTDPEESKDTWTVCIISLSKSLNSSRQIYKPDIIQSRLRKGTRTPDKYRICHHLFDHMSSRITP